jgi:plastocyanin
MRKLLVAVGIGALILSGCSKTPKGPQKYSIELDNKSTAKENFQYSAFFPASFKVSPGDTIKFRNRGSGAPHTVTFGVDAKRTNSPALLGPQGENPVAFGPCFNSEAPTQKLAKCESTKAPKTWDGKGYWNSGILQPKPAPKKDGPKTVTLKLGKNIKPGDYTFLCLLHPLMNGTLTVVTSEGDRTKPADVRKATRDDSAKAKAAAEKLQTPKLSGSGDHVVAAAGWGDNITAVNRFAPTAINVKTGTTVTWRAASPYEPHTVTFGTQKTSPFAPSGIKSGSDYSGGDANSGIFGAKGTPFAGEFALTFKKAGSYPYVCLLHPGMTGTVKVS